MKDNKNINVKAVLIVLIGCILLQLIFDTDFSNTDVLGFGHVFLRIIGIIFIIIELVILRIRILSPKDDFSSFSYKKMIVNLSFVLIIVLCFMGIGLRYAEEIEAIDYHEKNGNIVISSKEDNSFFHYYSYYKDNTEYKKNKRLVSIYEEIDNVNNQAYRYFLVFTTGLNLEGFQKAYYLIYTILAFITIVQLRALKKYFANIEDSSLLGDE